MLMPFLSADVLARDGDSKIDGDVFGREEDFSFVELFGGDLGVVSNEFGLVGLSGVVEGGGAPEANKDNREGMNERGEKGERTRRERKREREQQIPELTRL